MRRAAGIANDYSFPPPTFGRVRCSSEGEPSIRGAQRRNLLMKFTRMVFPMLLLTATVMAQPNVRVVGAKLEADPANYVGVCPTVIKFHGSIETDGPGVVKY